MRCSNDSRAMRAVREAIQRRPGMTTEEIAAESGVTKSTVQCYVRQLLDDEDIYISGLRSMRGCLPVREYSAGAEIINIPTAPIDNMLCTLLGIAA